MIYDIVFLDSLKKELVLSKKMLSLSMDALHRKVGSISKQKKGNSLYFYEKKRVGNKVITKYLGKSIKPDILEQIRRDKDDDVAIRQNNKALKKKISFLEKMIKKY